MAEVNMAGNYPNYKKFDFAEHDSTVTCLALGHISGHVLATGGDDRKVHLWAIGKPNRIMSLSGHSTSIQSVRFGHTESHLYAGSSAGVVMTWDLEAKYLFRTLTGHRGAIRTLEFHPYGDHIASGSADHTIKLWDLRRKGCLYTYSGHTGAVNHVKFSPDGNWIASASQDGNVKLWDVRIGKMLYEFSGHLGPVVSIEFHPRELLLASASLDNTVKFWDLDNFSLVSSTNSETPNTRCLHFNSNGDYLYAGASDVLRIYSWEPARNLNNLQIPWGDVQDLTTTLDSRLIGASFETTHVSVWVIDPSPQTLPPLSDPSISQSPFSHGNPLRKSFTKLKPTPEAKKALTVKTIEESERSETDPDEEVSTDLPLVEDYHRAFLPKRSLNRSPPISIYASSPVPSSSVSPIQAAPVEPEDTYWLEETIVPSEESFNGNTTFLIPPHTLPNVVERRRSISPQMDIRRHRPSRDEMMEQEPEFPVKLSSIHHSSSETNIPRVASTSHKTKKVQRTHTSKPLLRETKSDRGPPPSNVNSHMTHTSHNHSTAPETENFIPIPLDRPTGLIDDYAEFVPHNSYQGNANFSRSLPDMSEAEVLSSMMRGNESLMTILNMRALKLQSLYSIWRSQDLKASVESAVSDDPFVMSDFLRAIISRPNLWSLDICVILLPAVYTLLQSSFESHMKIGVDALRLILKNFSPVIKTNVMSGPVALGVDITREERYEKCIKCYNSLIDIRSFLLKRQTLQGPLGQAFRDLHIALQSIDRQ